MTTNRAPPAPGAGHNGPPGPVDGSGAIRVGDDIVGIGEDAGPDKGYVLDRESVYLPAYLHTEERIAAFEMVIRERAGTRRDPAPRDRSGI